MLVSVSYALDAAADVEELRLTGAATIDATGNARDNILVGNAGRNRLDGGAGDDLIRPGGGYDVVDGGTGTDVLDLAGAPSDYRLLQSGGHTFLVGARDALDVSGIEQVRFASGVSRTWSSILTDTAAFDGLR